MSPNPQHQKALCFFALTVADCDLRDILLGRCCFASAFLLNRNLQKDNIYAMMKSTNIQIGI